MKALTEKWPIVRQVAIAKLGLKASTVYKWHSRKSIPHEHRIALIRSSGSRLAMADFEDVAA